jgi:tetratricopeptide (TPR) repeat protein
MAKISGAVLKVRQAGWPYFLWAACLVVALAPRGLPAQAPSAPTVPSQNTAPARLANPELTAEDRADIFMAKKEFGDAVDYYLRALKQKSGRQGVIWNKLGIAYQQQLEYNSAREAYKKSLRYQKDYAQAWNNLGTTYFLQGKAKKSIKYYRHAIKLDDSNASFHVNLGTAYYHRKKFDQAMKEYRAALILDPNVLFEHSRQGTIVETRTGGEKYFFYLAKVFASLGRPTEAVRYLRRAYEEGFHDPKRLENDPDFQKISTDPAYVELIKNPPVAIKN